MAFSPDGKRLASVGLFGELQVRDLSSGKKYIAPKVLAWCLAYHPRGKLFVTGGNGTITLWDADSVKPRKTLKGHTDKVWALSFSSTGKLLASASSDKTVKLWDMDTGKEKATLRHPHYVYEAAFLKGDKLLATGSDALRLWDVDATKEIAALKPKGSNEVSLLAVSPDGKSVAFAPDGEQAKPPVVLWDIHTRKEPPGPDLKGQVASSLAFSPDGKLLAVGITDQAMLWNIGEGKEKAVLKGHYGPPNLLTFSPDSRTLAASDYEGTIRLWDVKARPKPGDEARKKADAAMLKKLTGTWDLDRPGRKPSKFAQNGDVWWDIDPEDIVITYHDGQTEQFQHKPFLDTSKNPMWLDLLYYRDQRVALGIFKLERDRLIYVEGKHYPVKEWQKAKGNLPGRPKDFKVKKGDEHRKQVLLRSAPPVPEKKVKP
jgi:uncharacterized protein (TIGR03067 family)